MMDAIKLMLSGIMLMLIAIFSYSWVQTRSACFLRSSL